MKFRSPVIAALVLGVSFFSVTAIFIPLARSQSAPASPSPLRATAVSSSRIDLSWQDTASETGFLIYRSLNANLSNPTILPAAQNSVSRADTGLAANTAYYYQVYACNDAGCASSNVANAKTEGAPSANTTTAGGNAATAGTIDKPILQSADAVSACAVELKWTQPESSPAASFELSVNNSNPFPAGTLSGHGQFSYTDPELTPSRNYSYKVRARPPIGEPSEFSDARGATTPAIPAPPAPPTALRVTSWEASGARAVLTWTISSQVSVDPDPRNSGFRIFRSDDGGTIFNKIDTISLKQFQDGVSGSVAPNTWEDGVSTDVLRIYRIKTYQTAASCEAVTNSTSDTESLPYVKFSALSSDLVVPARPASVSEGETKENRTKAKFQWSNVAREDTFNFQLSERQDFSTILKSKTYNRDTTETIHTPDEPEGFFTFLPNRTFYYRVRACAGAGGNSACSEYRVGATPYVSALVGPRDLTAFAAPRSATTANVSLNWKDTAGHLHKTRVYRKFSTDGDFPTTHLAELLGQECTSSRCESYPTSYIDEGLTLGNRTYDYKIAFVSVPGGVEGEPSKIVSVNLNLTWVKGWAWSGNGLGWIRLSNDSPNSSWGPATAPSETIPYSVYLNGADELGGYAWSPYAGWLSFNKGELKGCPYSTPLNEDQVCVAKVDPPATDKKIRNVTGWAKFISDGEGRGLGQFVSLSPKPLPQGGIEPEYKLVYAPTTAPGGGVENALRGFAWGGDVAGWLSFGGPVLKNVTPIPGTTSVTVEWENPITYSRVEIWRKTPSGQLIRRNEPFTGNAPEVQQGTNKRAVVDGLDPETTYEFFVRGYPQ